MLLWIVILGIIGLMLVIAEAFIPGFGIFGIAGGIGEGLLIKKGEIVKKVPEGALLDTLKYELDHWK